ncbi:MAG TPA: 2-C-methyl-D-erythritol 4-phosphate cytidylyltransferase [Candidatus Limnocylindrales bacterium]|nr:2-C-methyl-D-erythritol 4-phosphate cytidylyltransferase [Candidatus Limnocylindrales bacterium]
MTVAVVVAAAGESRRMGFPTRKQYLTLEGMSVLARAVGIFLKNPAVIQIIVVVPAADISYAADLLRPHCPPERVLFVAGGSRRQDSVYNGLQVVREEAELVCIHDGARPLASEKLVNALFGAAYCHGAAIPVVPLTDTLKVVTPEGFVKETPSRESFCCAQTPQVFRRELILKAYRNAAENNLEVTDDSALVEYFGHPVLTVPGEQSNIKVTSPRDLHLAKIFLRGEVLS